MSRLAGFFFLTLSLGLGHALAQQGAWPVLQPSFSPDGPFLVDLSYLQDRPAGGKGFVRITEGHLYDGSGTRLRLWGVNLVSSAIFPNHQQAAELAVILARHGVNCVRMHFMDLRSEAGLIDAHFKDSRNLSPEQLDRLDFFFSELKKNGIYSDFNLNVGRQFREADGVEQFDQLGMANPALLFDPKLIELQKEYAKALLSHKNAYTGKTYAGEPALALIELVNENSLIDSWRAGRLQPAKNPGPVAAEPFQHLPTAYSTRLTDLFNQWLKDKVPADTQAAIRKEAGVAAAQPVPRLAPDQFKSASPTRLDTEARFYVDLQRSYFASLTDCLKKEAGAKAAVIGTSIYDWTVPPYPMLAASDPVDVIDAHAYWQYPKTQQANGTETLTIKNVPMINDPAHSTVVSLARSAVRSKPFVVSEFNHPMPNEYGAEGIPLLASYAAFQDWDGVFLYALSGTDVSMWKPGYVSPFDLRQDGMRMAELAVGSLLFVQPFIKPGKQEVARSITEDQIYASLRQPGLTAPNFVDGMPDLLALQHRMRLAQMDAKKPGKSPKVNANPETDTAEMRWSVVKGQGIWSVNTPYVQGAAGFLKTNNRKFEHFGLEINNDFAVVLLVSLDAKPIRESDKMLLLTAGKTALDGATRDGDTLSVQTKFGAPVRFEPVTGAVVIDNLIDAKRLDGWPLDGDGRKHGKLVPSRKTLTGFRLPVGEPASPWWIVQVIR